MDELTLKLQKSNQLARENLIKSKEVNKERYDRKSNSINYNVGDLVYLENNKVSQKKLSANYEGPYKITI